MRIKILAALIFAVIVSGCTDARKASFLSFGKEHKVTMYNGGVLVREWISSGKVESMSQSDGWQFMDKATGKLVRVGGDVIIEVVE